MHLKKKIFVSAVALIAFQYHAQSYAFFKTVRKISIITGAAYAGWSLRGEDPWAVFVFETCKNVIKESIVKGKEHARKLNQFLADAEVETEKIIPEKAEENSTQTSQEEGH